MSLYVGPPPSITAPRLLFPFRCPAALTPPLRRCPAALTPSLRRCPAALTPTLFCCPVAHLPSPPPSFPRRPHPLPPALPPLPSPPPSVTPRPHTDIPPPSTMPMLGGEGLVGERARPRHLRTEGRGWGRGQREPRDAGQAEEGWGLRRRRVKGRKGHELRPVHLAAFSPCTTKA
ncbi:hypothetical protein H6P81_016717 [Aristolochia fimbriata]|uniref:Uncharacterized protein n=1 Tax=Aristolochia fimbriata TaxID=158543 RepID=A0AAV7ECX1_ARIFI|nr:hypothetical protein H6P81_016717 [Aristolochia fimbriata]